MSTSFSRIDFKFSNSMSANSWIVSELNESNNVICLALSNISYKNDEITLFPYGVMIVSKIVDIFFNVLISSLPE